MVIPEGDSIFLERTISAEISSISCFFFAAISRAPFAHCGLITMAIFGVMAVCIVVVVCTDCRLCVTHGKRHSRPFMQRYTTTDVAPYTLLWGQLRNQCRVEQ